MNSLFVVFFVVFVETIEQQPESTSNNNQQQKPRIEEETLTDSSTSESRIEFEAIPQPAHSQQNIFSHEPVSIFIETREKFTQLTILL